MMDRPALATAAAAPATGLVNVARSALRIVWSVLVILFLVRGCLLLVVWFFTSAPHNDFGMFYYTAYNGLHGSDMYAWTPIFELEMAARWTLQREALHMHLLNMNPPHFHVLLVPLTMLQPEQAYALWLVLSVFCLCWSFAAIRRELDATWSPRTRQLALMFFLGGEMTTEMVFTGQVTWMMLVPLTLLWLATRKEQWTRAGVCLGVLMAIKPFFLIFAPYYLLRGQWRVLLHATLSAAGCFLLGAAVFGADAYRQWVAAIGGSDAWVWWPNNASLWGALFVRTFSENPLFATFADVPLSTLRLCWLPVAGAVGVVTLLVASWSTGPQAIERAFAILLLAMLLLNPLAWAYYFGFPMFALAAVLIHWQRAGHFARPWHSGRAWLIGIAWACCLVPHALTTCFQPSPWLTLTLGNMYLWLTLATWLTLVCEAWPTVQLPSWMHARLAWRGVVPVEA